MKKIKRAVIVSASFRTLFGAIIDIKRKDWIEFLLFFIFEAKKFTATISVRPLFWETSVCKRIDKTSMAQILAAAIFY